MFKFLTVWCVECAAREPRAPSPCAQRPPRTPKAEATAPPSLALACAPFVSVIVNTTTPPHPCLPLPCLLGSGVFAGAYFCPDLLTSGIRELVRPHVCGGNRGSLRGPSRQGGLCLVGSKPASRHGVSSLESRARQYAERELRTQGAPRPRKAPESAVPCPRLRDSLSL